MGMRVLIIPEDFVKDQWILKPVFEAMFASLEKPRAKIRVCQDPRFNGVGQALKWDQIQLVLERYEGMVDLFILCVDRDADANRRAVLNGLEQKARDHLAPAQRRFFAEHAFQEVEVWVLAGMKDLPEDWAWSEIRDDRDPKERYYLPYARQRGVLGHPGEGRKVLGPEAAKNYGRLTQLCPELGELESRIG